MRCPAGLVDTDDDLVEQYALGQFARVQLDLAGMLSFAAWPQSSTPVGVIAEMLKFEPGLKVAYHAEGVVFGDQYEGNGDVEMRATRPIRAVSREDSEATWKQREVLWDYSSAFLKGV